MKHSLIFFVVIIFTSSFIAPVKKACINSKQAIIGYVFTTDGDLSGDGSVNLISQTATYQTGKGKTTSPIITISGLRSNFRISSGPVLKFLAHYDSGPMPPTGLVLNPYNDIMLYKFNVDKKNRVSASPVQTMFTPIDNVNYRAEFASGIVLTKGEYAFIDKTTLNSGNIIAWTFGID